MNKLIFGNLVHRPLRSVISALAVAIEVIMILSIVGIMYGILNGSRAQQSGTGYDMIVKPSKGSAILATSGASAPIGVANVLRGLPHVQVVSPVSIKIVYGTSGLPHNLLGIDYASYNALRPFHFLAGGPFTGPNDIILDDVEAANHPGLHVGDSFKEINQQFRVSGIVEHGKGAREYVPLTTLDQLDGSPGKAAYFALRTEDPPRFQKAVRAEVLAVPGLGGYDAPTLAELLSELTPAHIPALGIAIRVVIGIAAVIGFLVIFQSMYTAVMERTREIGILKSLGAGRGAIVSVVLRETGLLTVVGIALGIAVSFLLRAVLHIKNPSLPFQITGQWVVYATAITLVGALLGALYPALKAARKDAIEALAYE